MQLTKVYELILIGILLFMASLDYVRSAARTTKQHVMVSNRSIIILHPHSRNLSRIQQKIVYFYPISGVKRIT